MLLVTPDYSGEGPLRTVLTYGGHLTGLGTAREGGPALGAHPHANGALRAARFLRALGVRHIRALRGPMSPGRRSAARASLAEPGPRRGGGIAGRAPPRPGALTGTGEGLPLSAECPE